VLRLSWRNTAKQPVELHAEGPRAVTVEVAGGEARHLVLPAAPLGTVTLDAGKAVSSLFLLVAGRPEGKAEAPLEAVFPAAGKYQVTIDGFPTDGPLVITVAEPIALADRDARKNWTPAMIACLAGEVGKVKEAMLEQHVWQVLVMQEKGPYAGYALWAKARGYALIAAAHPEEDASVNRRDVAMKTCQKILDSYPETPVQELALEMQVEQAHALRLGVEARLAAQKLADKFPAGLALARLRQAYGKDLEKLATVEAPPAAAAANSPYVMPPMGPTAAAQELIANLPKRFTTWHITDGQQDRVPYEDVKKQAVGNRKVAEDKSAWAHHTAVMMNDKDDQLLITGQIHLVVGEGALAKDVDRRVRIMLAPDGKGGMLLRDVKVTDDPPVFQMHVGPPPPLPPPTPKG
jgi:hypothetical protein